MGDPSQRDVYAREAHASATLLAILMLLWGAVALPLVPAQFRWLDELHVVIGLVGVVWFGATRRRPRAAVGYAFCAAVIAFTLATLPWTTFVWCELRRPFEAVTVPQAAVVCMALIVPRSFALGVVVMALFVAEGLFVSVWANHVGQHALLPIGEPYITVYFCVPAIALLWLREERRRLAARHVALEAETAALARLGPLFVRVRDGLVAQLAVLSPELDRLMASAPMDRALDRLADVNARVAALVDGAPPADTTLERAFVAHDAQLGAAVLAGVAAIVGTAWAPVSAARLGVAVGVRNALFAVVALAVFAVLTVTRNRPSQLRGRAALLFVFAAGLAVVSADQLAYLDVTPPFAPFLGHKLLMVTLGVAAAGWSSMGLPLIVATTVDALVLWFALGFGALRDRVSITEPWVTLVFAIVGVGALVMRDQRRVASLGVLREESAATALHRRAVLLLALRDQLNTPLQTLVAGAARLALQSPSRDATRLQEGIARLVALSRELAQIEVPSESQAATLAERTLARG